MIWVIVTQICILICLSLIFAQLRDLRSRDFDIAALKSQRANDQSLIQALRIEIEELEKRVRFEQDQRIELERFKKRVNNAGQPVWED